MNAPLTLFDIRDVSRLMGSLHGYGMTVAFAVLPLAFALEGIKTTVDASNGEAGSTSRLWRVAFVIAALLGYRMLFDFIMWSVWVVQNTIVGIDTYMSLVLAMHDYQMSHAVNIFKSQVPTLIAWGAVFLAVVGDQVLGYIQYGILALLYFIGPISISLSIYTPTSYLIKTWFKNVFAVACWTLVLHVIVLALIQFNKTMYENQTLFDEANIIRTIVMSATFIVMVFFSPYFAEKIIAGQAMGSLAFMAATYLATASQGLASRYGIKMPGGFGNGFRGNNNLTASNDNAEAPLNSSAPHRAPVDTTSKNERWQQRGTGRARRSRPVSALLQHAAWLEKHGDEPRSLDERPDELIREQREHLAKTKGRQDR